MMSYLRHPRHVPPRRLLTVAAAITTTALLVTACSAPGSGNSGSNKSSKSPSKVSTNPAKAGKVTLREWDQEVRGGQNKEMKRLNKQFQKKYPNVTIKRTSKSFSDLKTTLKTALSGKQPPNVVEVNQGYPDMVSFVKAGLLRPLDRYDSKYGWSKRYPKALTDLNRVNADATEFGHGKLYGLSQMGEYVGIYYNKSKMKSLGIDKPKTWQDFTKALAKAKKAGQLPIQFGNLDKYPAIHTFGVIQDQMAGKKAVRNLVFGRGQTKWTQQPTVQAAKTLQSWTKRGYFPSGPNGIGYDDAAKKFAAGHGVFLITGTWEAADLKGPMGTKLGIMIPPPKSGAQPVTTGGESLALSITKKSKHPDVSAAYINFLTNKHADKVMTDTGNLAAVPPASAASRSGVDGQMVSGWNQINKADGLVPYLDYSTPTFYDTLTSDLQSLIGDKVTPEKFVKKLQKDANKFHHNS
jgi:raffinose/stachyose/melibiose transport system substrate-binding protein